MRGTYFIRLKLALIYHAHHVRRVLSEMHYAQRRLVEIRSGMVLTDETRSRLARAEVQRLEAHFHQGGSDPA